MADLPIEGELFGEAVGGQAAVVTDTGFALVHEGELVLPRAGTEAAAELAASDDRVIINYYFPVEIEVRGGGEAPDLRGAVELALSAFTSGLQNLT
jgi:hypothetical protein